MKKLLPFLFLTAALTLTACTSTPPAAPSATPAPTPEPTATPAPAQQTTFPVGHLTPLAQDPAWNTGEALYELQDVDDYTPEGRVMETDYTTLTQSVYCAVPGCTHDSDACPAYLACDFCTGVMVVDGDVYTYPTALENVAPTTIERIDPANGKTTVAAVPDALPHHLMLSWCDEYALYGVFGGDKPAKHRANTLYRWDWQNNTVQTIALLPDEAIVSQEDGHFLTTRLITDEAWPNFGGAEQENAILSRAKYEYAWLDPATGTREKICTRPYNDGSFFYYWDGKIYYSGNYRSAGTNARQFDILYFDTAGGQEKTFYENWPDDCGRVPAETFLPAFCGHTPQLVCMDQIMRSDWHMVDMQTGNWYTLPQLGGKGVHPVARTNDGKWVVSFNPHDRTTHDYHEYALYDPETCMAGGTPTALFTMYATE